jgi:hypothetical protein
VRVIAHESDDVGLQFRKALTNLNANVLLLRFKIIFSNQTAKHPRQ